MNRARLTLLAIVVLLLLILLPSTFYTVSETEQVIITRFGKPVRDPIFEPGLKMKTPFVETVNRFDKRLIEWDGDAKQIPTGGKRYIWVDSTARWRIVDPLLFYRKVRDVRGAMSRIDDFVDSDTRTVISDLKIIESVRSSNKELLQEGRQDMREDLVQEEFNVEVGRHNVGIKIKEMSAQRLTALGIELVDVRLRRVNYVERDRLKVYDRMISERRRIAEKYRSEGLGEKAKIDGMREKKRLEIESGAYKEAEEIRGRADAEAARIYAESFGADPEFYTFMKTLESYKEALAGQVHLILTTDSDFFIYLRGSGMDIDGSGSRDGK